MKKNYAHHLSGGEKLFCKTELTSTGVLVIDFYLPKSEFSVKWERNNLVAIKGIRETADERKSIVTYLVHPSFWLGDSFGSMSEYLSIQDALDYVFTEYINLHV